jgi:hypothetical protein
LWREITSQFNARNLPFRMNSGIGAPGAVHNDVATIEQREHPSQLALHGAQSVLDLPTVKIGTVVLEKEFEVHDCLEGGLVARAKKTGQVPPLN